MEQATRPPERPGFLLPDLCAAQTVLFIVLVAELVALCLVLFATGAGGFDWNSLGRTSLFVQWLVLSSTALLCWLRPWLARKALFVGASLSYGLILLLCLLFSLAAQLLLIEMAQIRQMDSGLVLRNLLLCAVLAGVTLRYFHLQAELQRRQQAELQARIEALHARIRPHFLFNSMNSIASLIADEPEAAEKAVEDLAELFRASLRDSDAEVDVEDELSLCRRYLDIETHRLGDRLRVAWKLGALPAGLKIPPLSLQPLVENAVYHGIQPRPEGGEIRIEVEQLDGQLRLRVTNPLAATVDGQQDGHNMALANIRDRLQALHGDAARLDLETREQHFVATLSLPMAAP